nr:MAG TPA: hypothetical protein [Caudoviricetes sp.]
MHVGYKHPDGKRQRGQYLSMIHGKYYHIRRKHSNNIYNGGAYPLRFR